MSCASCWRRVGCAHRDTNPKRQRGSALSCPSGQVQQLPVVTGGLGKPAARVDNSPRRARGSGSWPLASAQLIIVVDGKQTKRGRKQHAAGREVARTIQRKKIVLVARNDSRYG